MKIIVLPRAGGKTHALLEWMRAAPEGEHRIAVCFSGQEAMRLLRENRDLESWQFVGWNEVFPYDGAAWSAVLYGRGGRIVLGIDNLDLILSNLLGWHVGTVTMTGTVESKPTRWPQSMIEGEFVDDREADPGWPPQGS